MLRMILNYVNTEMFQQTEKYLAVWNIWELPKYIDF